MNDSKHHALVSKALAVREQVVQRHLKGELVYDRDLTALAHEIIVMARLDETFAVGQLFNAMGVIEFDRGHFIAAYDYTMSALHCFEEIKHEERMRELAQYIENAEECARSEVEKRRVQTWKQGIWEYMKTGHDRFYAKTAVD